MSMTFKEYLHKGITMSRDFYLKDLDALPEDKLGVSPGGQARTPYDFTWEVVVVNNRVASQLKGEDPGAWPFPDGWAVAPDDVKSKETIKAKLSESVDNVLAAMDAKSEEELTNKFTPEGQEQETTFANMCNLVAYHTGYHGAQLNYIQSMLGDMEVHWS